MIEIAVHDAMLAATSGGAMVLVKRALGWSRTLWLTPLRPGAYVAIEMIVAMPLAWPRSASSTPWAPSTA